MVHSGYEASAVNDTFGSFAGLLRTARSMLFAKHSDAEALKMLEEEVRPIHSYDPFVQISGLGSEVRDQLEETHA